MVLHVLVACRAAQVEQIALFLLRMLFTKVQNNICPTTLSLSSPQVWLVTL